MRIAVVFFAASAVAAGLLLAAVEVIAVTDLDDDELGD